MKPPARILFGSCLKQSQPAPVLQSWIRDADPVADLVILAGDNVYADTEDADGFRDAYRTLEERPEFQALRERSPVVATWDDHDYGVDDGGESFAAKRIAKAAFLETFGREDDPRSERAGIYDSQSFGPPGREVQVILLDTRWFRSDLSRLPERPQGRGPYVPQSEDTAQSMLGEVQWGWFERKLREPAAFRIIVSSVQVLADEHGWECWANLPAERDRLFDLLEATNPGGAIFISGDRHHAEISVWDESENESLGASPAGFPIVDVTSSSLNAGRGEVTEPNRFRRGRPYGDPNYGLISIDWSAADPVMTIEICNVEGQAIRSHRVKRSELTAGGSGSNGEANPADASR